MAVDQEHQLNLQHVYFGADIERLKAGQVEVLAVMSYNELFTLFDVSLAKEDLVIFPIADFGYNIPEDGVYTSREFFKNNPELCNRFAQATVKGWKAAGEDRDQALEIVMPHQKRSIFQTSRLHQERMLNEVLHLIGDLSKHKGQLNQNDFNQTLKVLKQIKLIKKDIRMEDFCARLALS